MWLPNIKNNNLVKNIATLNQVSIDILQLNFLHPIVSGNKLLKLYYYIPQAIKENKGVLTMGGPWSNHIHATAYSAFINKLPCTIVVKATNGFTTQTIQDCINWNAKIIYVNKNEFYNTKYWHDFALTNNLVFIPMGGDSELGMAGVKTFFNNINLPFYDAIFCAVGTGTTVCGIAESTTKYNNLFAINPAIKDDNIAIKINKLGNRITLKKELHFGKFGSINEPLINYLNYVYKQYNVKTDVMYTAKLFYCVEQMVINNYFNMGTKILIVHTGGLQGNRSLQNNELNF